MAASRSFTKLPSSTYASYSVWRSALSVSWQYTVPADVTHCSLALLAPAPKNSEMRREKLATLLPNRPSSRKLNCVCEPMLKSLFHDSVHLGSGLPRNFLSVVLQVAPRAADGMRPAVPGMTLQFASYRPL